MTDTPFKLRVLRALTDALKEIVPASGYHHDLADFARDDGVTIARVYRGRAWFGESDPIPLVSILEGTSPADDVAEPFVTTATGNLYDWPILIQGFVDDDADNPTDPAYLLLADVRRRLAVEQDRKAPGSRSKSDPFGMGTGKNRVEGFQIGSGVVRPADDVSSKAWFWLSITLRVAEDAGDPYA